jgi:hypothetical protein
MYVLIEKRVKTLLQSYKQKKENKERAHTSQILSTGKAPQRRLIPDLSNSR